MLAVVAIPYSLSGWESGAPAELFPVSSEESDWGSVVVGDSVDTVVSVASGSVEVVSSLTAA